MPPGRPPGLVALAVAALLSGTACDGSPPDGPAAGTVTISIGEPVAPLVPGATTEESGGQVLESLWTGLVEYGPDGGIRWTGVAESVESADDTTWTIRLHDGWTFHDGSPVTASSFVDAWNATAWAPNAMGGSYALADVVGYTDLQGTDGGEPAAREMSGLRVVDDRTFTVTLTAPFASFPVTLGQRVLFPLPEAWFEDPAGFGRRPVGNGPFRAEGEFVPGRGITLRRYEDYAGPRPAAAEAVEYRVHVGEDTGYTEPLAGDLDVLPGASPDVAARVRSDDGVRVVGTPTAGLTHLALPLYDERWADPRVRRALSLAIDRAAIAEALFAGTRRPADALVAPGVPGHRDGACGYCVLDVDRANALLDEAGFDRGRPVELWFNAGAGNDAWIEAVGNQLRSHLGVEFLLHGTLAPAEYLGLVAERGMTGPFRHGWAADYPSPRSFLEPLFASRAHPPAGANLAFYADPAFDALLAEANAAPTEEEALAAYDRAEDVVLEAMPVVPLFVDVTQTLYSEDVEDVVVEPFGGVDTSAIRLAR
ncbi:ABC transporter substrate-binding protein [Geodermatophilus sp. SYSU D01045]